MTEERFWEIVGKADSGDVEAMQKAAFMLMEVAEKNIPDGNMELAMLCLKKSDEYTKKLQSMGIW